MSLRPSQKARNREVEEAVEPEETEWPEIEPSDIEEPLEGFEGEESTEPPED